MHADGSDVDSDELLISESSETKRSEFRISLVNYLPLKTNRMPIERFVVLRSSDSSSPLFDDDFFEKNFEFFQDILSYKQMTGTAMDIS